MDESKNKNDFASNATELSTVTASEHADSGKITEATTPVVVDSVASEEAEGLGKGNIEGSSRGDVMAKESGSCNGDEVLVRGSSSEDVDGGCTGDLGDGDGGGGRKETAACGHAEGDAQHSDDGGVIGDLGAHENRCSGVEASNSEVESSKVAGSEEEGKPVEGGEKEWQVSGNGDGTSQEVQELRAGQSSKFEESEGKGEPVEGGEEEMEVGGDGGKTSSEVGATDTDADVQCVNIVSEIGGETQAIVEEATIVTDERSLKRETVEEEVEGVDIDASQKVNSRVVGLSENESQDQRAESGAGGPSMAVGSSLGETQAIEKCELVEEAAGKAEQKDGNVNDALQDAEAQEVLVLHDEVWNSGNETAVVSSPSTVEDMNVETKVVAEVVVMANIEGLDSKVEATRSDALKGELAGDLEGIISTSESSPVLTEKDSIANSDSDVLDKQTQVAIEGRVSSTDDKNITCPNNEGMDTDAFCESFCFSVEELQGTSEIANGSIENGYNACADSQSSYQPAQVVAGAVVVAKEDNVLMNPEKNKKAITACSVNDTVEAGQRKEQVIIVCQQQKVETINERTEIRIKTTCGGMKMDAETCLTHNDEVLTSHTEVPDPSAKDQQLKPEEGLEKSASSDPAHVDPIKEQLMEVQEQATQDNELGGEKKNLEEQNSHAETASVCTETDTQLMDVGGNVIASNKESLNSKTELKDLAESDQQSKVEEGLDEGASQGPFDIVSNTGQEMTIEEHFLDAEQVDIQGQEMEVEEQDIDTEQPNTMEDKSSSTMPVLKPGSSEKEDQACYLLPPDNEVELSVSDLVWGKVRSHPWWPGQIFDPSDASEKAMRYHKKDCYLVAYFGDRTFAWNEASLLKPFRSHFSQVEKQSNSEVFQNAVGCALEEVSRRVELGLACSCVPKDDYDEIKCQVVENAGIRPEASIREGVDKDTSADSFQPDKLVDYMKALARSPAGGANRLEFLIAKSQLLAFYRLKGYSELPEYQFCGGLLEKSDALLFEDRAIDHTPAVYGDNGQISSGEEISQTQRGSSHKRKHNLKDSIYPSKKEKYLSDLISDSWDSVDDEIGSDRKANSILVSPSGKKRKGPDTFADDASTTGRRNTISFAKVSSTTLKPSFKIGECIQRVASQMTGSPSILKCNSPKVDGSGDGLVGDGSDASFLLSEDAEIKRMIVPAEYSSLDDLLSQLHLTAQDPLKGYGFLNIIISFFSDFRNSVVMDQHDKVGGKRKTSQSSGGFPETFEFEDMNDTYWTDRVIQNGSEEQPPRKSRKKDNLFVPVVLDKPSGRSNSRKQYSDRKYDVTAQKPAGYVDEKAPAELVMHFPVVDSVPSEISLNKMFRRFGPLKESETEVDRDTNRARVIFKRCSDAEAAYGSAPKFNIFGPILVNYQLNYSISVPFKTPPLFQDEEDATLFLQY